MRDCRPEGIQIMPHNAITCSGAPVTNTRYSFPSSRTTRRTLCVKSNGSSYTSGNCSSHFSPWDLRLRSSVLLFRRTTHSRWRKTPPPSRQTEVRENLADARVPRRERNCPRDYIRPPSHETPCLRYTLSVLPVRLW